MFPAKVVLLTASILVLIGNLVAFMMPLRSLNNVHYFHRIVRHSMNKISMSTQSQYVIGQSVPQDSIRPPKNNITSPTRKDSNGHSVVLQVYVDKDILTFMKMKSAEKKARILLPAALSEIAVSNTYLRDFIERKLLLLSNKPYVLRVHVPGLSLSPRQFTDDEELHNAVLHAQNTASPVRLFVDPSPGLFPPPTLPYLIDMPDPLESETITLLSFYRFYIISSPEDLSNQLRNLWRPFKVVGRVYVATEGINAQMAVPSNVLPQFKLACESNHLLSGILLNIDHQMSRSEFELSKPFKALHIRAREQIVADGWEEPLDWNKSGREMPPLEWHRELENPNAIVLDCRNSYESDVGRFDRAIPLNTTFFRESWQVLEETLQGVDKDVPILTYCTGGIRCVKINAFLEQKLGFRNVSRLQGGIVSYTRELAEATLNRDSFDKSSSRKGYASSSVSVAATKPVAEEVIRSADGTDYVSKRRNVPVSKFRGVNYVFDERMGSAVTAEVLSQCESCGRADDRFTNCRSDLCHIRFIQCEACSELYSGCCSLYCKSAHAKSQLSSETDGNKAMFPRKRENSHKTDWKTEQMVLPQQASNSHASNNIDPLAPQAIFAQEDSYLAITGKVHGGFNESRDLPPSSLPKEKDVHQVAVARASAVEMYCDRVSETEPALLTSLRRETVKMYGHSEGAIRMLCSPSQGRLLTMLARITNATSVLELGTFTGYSALCLAEGLANTNAHAGPSRVVSCDVDALPQQIARQFVSQCPWPDRVDIRTADAADVLDNLEAEGAVFDMAFLDADKRQYEHYVERIIRGNLLRPGGLIIADNTLWKGLVLHEMSDLAETAERHELYGKAERMKKLAGTMHSFNMYLSTHPRLRTLMLPLRDGLTVAQLRESAET